jgi:hypothetical protein
MTTYKSFIKRNSFLKRIASACPAVAAGLASEYDKELFLALRYPAVLSQGIFILGSLLVLAIVQK